MSNEPVPSVGGKDLQDFKRLPRAPELSYLQKQALPRQRRAQRSPPKRHMTQRLADLATADWVRWLYEYARFRIGPRRPFRTYDDPAGDDGVYALGEGVVRVAIAGDWGTGTDEAILVAKRMKAHDPHYTIHLGDIYFVGDPAEARENFLGIRNPKHDYKPASWPRGSQGAFALNGNHEMYARGAGYFDLVLPAMGMASGEKGRPQKASFFCLENAHWRVIGLDTGYNSIGAPFIEQIFAPDCALPDALIAWLRDVLKQKDDRRGIVLMSHHQYFSAFDDFYVKPAEQLAEFIDRPVLWFWGHEHRMAIYGKERAGAGIEAYGRCLGHGGMPVELLRKPRGPAAPHSSSSTAALTRTTRG